MSRAADPELAAAGQDDDEWPSVKARLESLMAR